MNYEKLLDGKKAIITAGADGIGYAIAKRFEKAGAHVFVCDINKEAVIKANSVEDNICLLYTSPSPRDAHESRMPSSA